jgi:hypothetical protein
VAEKFQQKKCGRNSAVGKVWQKKCGRKSASGKVGRKSAAEKSQQEMCGRKNAAEKLWQWIHDNIMLQEEKKRYGSSWMILGAKFPSWANFPWFFQKRNSLF